MRHILIIAILALSFIGNVNAAEGRRTAFVGGAVVGTVLGFLAHDAIVAKPTPTVVRVESAPVVETRVIYVREVKPAPEYVIIDGRAYEIVRSAPRSTFCTDNGWRPAPTHRMHGLDR
jgi:hypothetical protein